MRNRTSSSDQVLPRPAADIRVHPQGLGRWRGTRHKPHGPELVLGTTLYVTFIILICLLLKLSCCKC
ncbi:unnamed protein product [Leptidea sinapis]|uniref:Uncharacterized protein n=1 Tax=Leptidea sinapis TaxID=189913 RepID=A0A5E4PZB1_9NEOP|nr:unnamed protein product [Leptidea sinapis]